MMKFNKKGISLYMAVVVLLIFLYFFGVLRPVESVVIKVLNPVLVKIHSLSSDLRIKYNEQTSKKDLVLTIKKLEEQVNQLTEENAKLENTKEENEILRNHLNFLSENNYKYLMSNVISRGDVSDNMGQTESLIIDKGLKDGVRPGLAVVSSKGIVIGKISESKDNVSKVYLTNSKCKLAATLLSEEKTSGITEGELGLTIKMGFIPQSKKITADDVVITSGLEEGIPRGLVIGRVTEVKKENNDLWQTAIIEPLVDPEDLVIVSVLLP